MWHADTVGLPKVYQRICEFHHQHRELWAPAPLLKRLAESGKTFAEFDREQSAAGLLERVNSA
jgi:3-hydroxyacyl-CoA dehydrogenase